MRRMGANHCPGVARPACSAAAALFVLLLRLGLQALPALLVLQAVRFGIGIVLCRQLAAQHNDVRRLERRARNEARQNLFHTSSVARLRVFQAMGSS